MSNVNVKRLVENIRSGTNIYTPLVELIVNAIQAIDAKGMVCAGRAGEPQQTAAATHRRHGKPQVWKPCCSGFSGAQPA